MLSLLSLRLLMLPDNIDALKVKSVDIKKAGPNDPALCIKLN